MATNLLLEGDDPEALLERAQAEGGPRARIVRLGKVRQGGVMGFFAKERYEVAVEIPDDDGVGDEPRPSNDTLLSSLGERTQTPFERQMADREDAERRMNLPSQQPAPQPERLRPAYGPAAPQISAPQISAPQTVAGRLPGPVEAVAAVPPRAAGPVAPIGAVSATPPQPARSYADVQDTILHRRQDDHGHDHGQVHDHGEPVDAPALARRGLLDIVDRVNAVERAATRAVAGQPLGDPEGVQFTLPLPRPSSGSPSAGYSPKHEHEQIAASAAFAASYARAHTGTVEDFMTDDVAALAALRQRPFEMATFPVAAALGQPLAPAPLQPDAAAEPHPPVPTEPQAPAAVQPTSPTEPNEPATSPEPAPEPVVTTIDDLTVRVDTPSTRRQNTPWDDSDDPEADTGPMADHAAPAIDAADLADLADPASDPDPAALSSDADLDLDLEPDAEATLPLPLPLPTSLLRTESIEAEAAAAVRHAADHAAAQARAEAQADLARRQAELEATVQAQVRALAAAQIAQAESARHEAEQLVRQAVEAAERTAREALATAERLTGEARESAAEQTRSMAELIAQREQAAAAAAVKAERERSGRDAARYWPGQGGPTLGNPMRQPLPVSRITGNELVDPVTGEAQPPARNDTQVMRDRSRLRDLGVPVAWTRRLRGGDRLSSVLRILEGLPQSDLDRSTPVVAVVGPTGAAQFEAHRLALDLHVGNQPRPVVVVPARGSGRVAAMATVHRLATCVVAIECQDGSDLHAVLEALEVVEPSAVVAMVDAGAPVAATQEWLDALQTVDLLTVDGAVDAAQPAAVLRLGLPVLRLDGTVVDRTAWAALLTARLEAADADETPER